ncbi:MAG: hypothetical protein HZB67_06080, partial [Candidatus Aenigmarchaeota archaeon]|nr:hypothetical protein [Candidatus Aenigmarchaeota archaeon]
MPIDTVQAIIIGLACLLLLLTLFGGIVKDIFLQLEAWGKNPQVVSAAGGGSATCDKQTQVFGTT